MSGKAVVVSEGALCALCTSCVFKRQVLCLLSKEYLFSRHCLRTARQPKTLLHNSIRHQKQLTPATTRQIPNVSHNHAHRFFHRAANSHILLKQPFTPSHGHRGTHETDQKWRTALNGHQLILVNGHPTRDRTILVQCSPNLPNASAVNLNWIHLSNSLLEAQQKLNDTINTHFAPVRCAYGAYNYQETKNEHGEPMYGVQLYLRQTDKVMKWELWQVSFAGK
jgi:hypothetical protein